MDLTEKLKSVSYTHLDVYKRQEYDDAVRVRAIGKLQGTHVKTMPYPGFPTDMQPQIAVTLALAEGTSIVTESIFEKDVYQRQVSLC